MKILQHIHKLYGILIGEEKLKAYRLLQQQRQLLYSGIEVSAEITDISLLQKTIGSMQLIRLGIKLPITNGSYIYTHTQALISLNKLPQKGQSLRIKYLPDDLSSVMVM